jgi:hypothetical protein
MRENPPRKKGRTKSSLMTQCYACPQLKGPGAMNAQAPGYWMHETSGRLRPAVEAYPKGAPMTGEQTAALSASPPVGRGTRNRLRVQRAG